MRGCGPGAPLRFEGTNGSLASPRVPMSSTCRSQMFESNTKLSSAILRNGWTGRAALRARLEIVTAFGRSWAWRFPDSIGFFLHQIGGWTRPAQLAKNQY